MTSLRTARDWAAIAQRAAAAMDGDPDQAAAKPWPFATRHELCSANSLLRLAGWTAFYTVALILIGASVEAHRTPGKTFQINFEYKVF